MTGTIATRAPTGTAGPAKGYESARRPFGLARHSLALAGRSLTKTRRNPGVLLDAVLLPVIFLFLFVYLFGGAVAGSTRDYLQYVFPGILVMTTLLTGMLATGVTINLDIKKGVFDRFRSLPIGRSAPLIGSVVGDLIRYVVALAVLFGIAYLMGFRVQTGPLAALAAAALAVGFSFCLSWITVLVGVLIREPVVVQSVAFLGIFPLAFGTNMVAPTETMPGWLQAWIDVNPVTHAVAATRGLLLGGPVAGPATNTLLWSAALLVVLAPLAVGVYRRRA
jgi:oleandomycin transport system permease protein